MTVERMIELLEIEKECVLRNASGECNRYCAGCDLLQDDTELHEMYTEAIALLKAQEPRVMTVADIVDNHVAPEVVWVEARNNKGDIRLVAGLWNGEYYNMADDSVMYDLGEEIANNPEGYNTRFRFWTFRPTDEVRRATQWN